MDQQSELKYLIDKLIDQAEKNLDLQSNTIKALQEMKALIGDNSRDHSDIKGVLSAQQTLVENTLSKIRRFEEHGIIDAVEEITSIMHSQGNLLNILNNNLTELRGIYSQVRIMLYILLGIATLVGVILGIAKAVSH